LAWVKESMAASAPALEEQELADQVKAQLVQSSRKRSARRAGAHRSTADVSERETGGGREVALLQRPPSPPVRNGYHRRFGGRWI